MNVKEVWSLIKHDEVFMKYFPDTFRNRTPPAGIFGKYFRLSEKMNKKLNR